MLKLTGLHSDVEISKILLTKGLKIDRKKLGTIWKNPFYCGINRNKMLDEAVEGNWEKIISKKISYVFKLSFKKIIRGINTLKK